jgi:hypothetical protein
VNSYTEGYQVFGPLAMDSEGDFVVAWTSDGSTGTDSDGYSIQAQRYFSSGAAVGSEFQVNAYTIGLPRAGSCPANRRFG